MEDKIEALWDQYASLAEAWKQTAETARGQSDARLTEILEAGQKQYAALLEAARKETQSAQELTQGVAAQNGNLGKLGQSQYGTQGYDQARGEISAAQSALETAVERQSQSLESSVAAGSAQAESAAAQGSTALQRQESIRQDDRAQQDYENEVTAQREAEAAQRETQAAQESLTAQDRTWQRNLGELLLKQGVMPTDTALEAMGITQETAGQYIALVEAQRAQSSSTSSSKSSKSSTSSSKSRKSSTSSSKSSKSTSASSTSGTSDEAASKTTAYSNQEAAVIQSYLKQGNYDKALARLKAAYEAGSFSEANYKLIHRQIAAAMLGAGTSTKSSGVKDASYWNRYYG